MISGKSQRSLRRLHAVIANLFLEPGSTDKSVVSRLSNEDLQWAIECGNYIKPFTDLLKEEVAERIIVGEICNER